MTSPSGFPATSSPIPKAAILALSLAAFGSGASLRITDPQLPRLATDFGLSLAGRAGAGNGVPGRRISLWLICFYRHPCALDARHTAIARRFAGNAIRLWRPAVRHRFDRAGASIG